jgi:hypothetical protein
MNPFRTAFLIYAGDILSNNAVPEVEFPSV